MKSTSRIFTVSAVFFFVVDVVYWLASYEMAGTIMFGLWGVSLLFAARYLDAAAKRGAPVGDDPDLRPEDAAGEWVGAFASSSTWPVVLAAGLAVGMAGLLYGAWLTIPAALVTIVALLGLMRESAAL